MAAPTFWLARQPIFDSNVRVKAYEVLFRACNAPSAPAQLPEFATASVGVQSLLDLGLDRLVGDSNLWVNIPRDVLVSGQFEFFPPKRVVLELLESIAGDSEVLTALTRAKSLGFEIALDDFVLTPRTAALVPLADYVKLDTLALGMADLPQAIRALRRPGLRLLAEKVETHEMFKLAKGLGGELFQGYFFARPQLVQGRSVANNRTSLLRVVSELQHADASVESIEHLIRSDVGLTYRLLRYVNSVAVGPAAPIESIRHAIMILGFERVRTCVLVLLLIACEDKPNELVAMSLARARFCQLLCEFSGLDPARGFLVGLMSMIDAFLDRELESIITEIGLADDVARALIDRDGELGSRLNAAIACESADWEHLDAAEQAPEVLQATYLEAISWSTETQASLAVA